MPEKGRMTILTSEISVAVGLPVSVVCLRLRKERCKALGAVKRKFIIDEEWDLAEIPREFQDKVIKNQMARGPMLTRWLQRQGLSFSKLANMLGLSRQCVHQYVKHGVVSVQVAEWFLQSGCPADLLPGRVSLKKDKRLVGWLYLNELTIKDVAKGSGLQPQSIKHCFGSAKVINVKVIRWLYANGCPEDLMKAFYDLAYLPLESTNEE